MKKIEHSSNSSGAFGVYRRRSRAFPWGAHIVDAGLYRHVGVFATEAEAVTARKAATRRQGDRT